MEHLRQSREDLLQLDASELILLYIEVGNDLDSIIYALAHDAVQDGSYMHNMMLNEQYQLAQYQHDIWMVGVERNILT